MPNEQEKSLEQVLRDTPWSRILVPLAIALLAVLISIAAVAIED